MNETYSGGIGSFLLTMMVVSFLQMKQRLASVSKILVNRERRLQQQQHHRQNNNMMIPPQSTQLNALANPSWNLGTLLLEFFQLYGISFNYFSTGICIPEGGAYVPKRRRTEDAPSAARYGLKPMFSLSLSLSHTPLLCSVFLCYCIIVSVFDLSICFFFDYI
jgi:DNA polymerase sigma